METRTDAITDAPGDSMHPIYSLCVLDDPMDTDLNNFNEIYRSFDPMDTNTDPGAIFRSLSQTAANADMYAIFSTPGQGTPNLPWDTIAQNLRPLDSTNANLDTIFSNLNQMDWYPGTSAISNVPHRENSNLPLDPIAQSRQTADLAAVINAGGMFY
jgi:hypothetical protein